MCGSVVSPDPASAELSGSITRRPLVSVVMPMRNNAATVGAAIRSIQLQTLSDWELIVIDDGSKDESSAIAASFRDRRIHLIRDTKTIGLAERLNQAIALSKGEFIARMDADDLCFPERLALQVLRLQQDPTIDLLACGAVVFASNGTLLGTLPLALTHENITARPFSGFPFPHPTWCGRSEWFRNNPYSPTLLKAQDQDLLLRAFRSSRFEALPDVLLGYRQDTLSLKKMLHGRGVFIGSIYRHIQSAGDVISASGGILLQILKGAVDVVTVGFGLNSWAQRQRLKPVPLSAAQGWLRLQLALNDGRPAGT